VYRSHLETGHQLLSGVPRGFAAQRTGGAEGGPSQIVLHANVRLDKNLSVFL
jgi:hypothetical protein